MSVSQAITKNDLINVLEEVVNIDGNDLSQQEINDFVQELSVTGIQAADYVVEQGTSGIWTYRKWNSGISECWGASADITYSPTSTWGNGKFQEGSLSFPSNLFVSAPALVVHAEKTNNTSGMPFVSTKSKSASQFSYYLFDANSTATGYTFKLDTQAKGRWK